MLEHRLSIAAAATTFLLLLLGGLVHATGSSLACPDWPLCFGQFFPEMVGGVLVEHSHRLVASGVGVLTFALGALVLARRKDDRAARAAAVAAMVLVVVQGVLGGVTVLLQLSVLASTAHLAISQLYFGILLYLAVRTWPGRVTQAPEVPALVPLRRKVAVATGAVFAQVVLGGLVRHLGAGLVCGGEFPLCQGGLVPTFALGWLHMSHRVLAFAVLGAVLWATVPVALRARQEGRAFARNLAVASHGIIVVQIGLGIWSLLSYLGVEAVVLHLGGGALLLADLVILYLLLTPACWAATGGARGAWDGSTAGPPRHAGVSAKPGGRSQRRARYVRAKRGPAIGPPRGGGRWMDTQ